ncbi:MAG: hypothetical protein FJW23_16010 [Acidimicrobiia bacterium]|nr:hypothetical protein [Acidimicrobiia bacterium]
MLFEWWQDAVVTLVAVGCAAFIVSRVVGLVRPRKAPGCANCPSSNEPARPDQEPAARPLVLVRPKRAGGVPGR